MALSTTIRRRKKPLNNFGNIMGIMLLLLQIILMLTSNLGVVVHGQEVLESILPAPEDPYPFLHDMSDVELDKLITSLGFQMLDPTDPVTGAPIPKTHELYVEAARQCLEVQEEMGRLLEEHPELKEEYERELEELVANEKSEQERLLQEKEQLEAELMKEKEEEDSISGDDDATPTEEVVDDLEDDAFYNIGGETEKDDEEEEEEEDVDEASTIVEEEKEEIDFDDDDDTTSSATPITDNNTTDDVQEDEKVENDDDRQISTEGIPSMEEQWAEIRDALIPKPIQKFLVRYVQIMIIVARRMKNQFKSKVWPPLKSKSVEVIEKVVPENVRNNIATKVWNPIIESGLIPKVILRLKQDSIRVYNLVRKQISAILLPFLARLMAAPAGDENAAAK